MFGAHGFEVRNRPDWLYDSLPYVYIAIGLIAMVAFCLTVTEDVSLRIIAVLDLQTILGEASGFIFVSAGLAVFVMRWKARGERAKLKAELAEANGETAAASCAAPLPTVPPSAKRASASSPD